VEIRILGMGCPNCERLQRNVFNAAAELGIDADIQKVDDMQKILDYGVMTTPALVVDGTVLVKGRVPTKEELMKLLGGA